MFEIVAAHGIEYTSTTSAGYIQDLLNKVKQSKVCRMGLPYILCVCALPDRMGGLISDSAIDIVRRWWTGGLWYRAGREDGEFVSNRNPKEFRISTGLSLFRQARFRHLKDEDVAQIIPERTWSGPMIRKS